MNKFLVSLILCLGIALPSSADNLLSYVQVNLNKDQVQAFSAQGLAIKECDSCPTVRINPSNNVSYWEQNQEITLKTATEVYVRGQHNFISVFYNRPSRQYDKIIFGSYDEVEPLHYLPKPSAQ